MDTPQEQLERYAEAVILPNITKESASGNTNYTSNEQYSSTRSVSNVNKPYGKTAPNG